MDLENLAGIHNKLQMYSFQEKKHHILICENSVYIDNKKDSKSQKPAVNGNEKNREKAAMFINAKTGVLLQTADYIISNRRENRSWR